MIVIASMTGDTRDRRIFVCMLVMALLAFHFRMLAIKGKCGQPVVKHSALPVAFVMAIVALLSLFALVHIIHLVTGVTCFTQLFLAQHALVTGSALDANVFAAQREAGFLAVMVNRLRPGFFCVTSIALLAKSSLVPLFQVIALVTRIALLRCFLVVLVFVAQAAFNLAVFAHEWIVGFTVIEPDLLPVNGDMATFTVLAQPALVGIVLPMAAITIVRRLTMLFILLVTILAFYF